MSRRYREFDDGWVKSDRYIDVSSSFTDDPLHYTKVKIGSKMVPMRYRFAKYIGKTNEDSVNQIECEIFDWLSNNFPRGAWCCDMYQGPWFYVDMAYEVEATAFKLIWC